MAILIRTLSHVTKVAAAVGTRSWIQDNKTRQVLYRLISGTTTKNSKVQQKLSYLTVNCCLSKSSGSSIQLTYVAVGYYTGARGNDWQMNLSSEP